MQRVSIIIECDLRDGLEATPTSFSLDNTPYDIDLCSSDMIRFHETVSNWARHARKVKSHPGRYTPSGDLRRPQVIRNWGQRVRTWAKEQGYDITPNGRIGSRIKADYVQATGDRRPVVR